MTERQWELYRRSVVDQIPESSYKSAVIAAIAHKLMILSRHDTGAMARSVQK
jgi:hypothetical protein